MITSFTASPAGPNAWRLDWSSDLISPTFYLYRDGVLFSTTTETSIIVGVEPGAAPVFEVLDTAAAPSAGYPATAVLAWYAGSGVDYYLVEQNVAAVWTELARVTDDGSPWFMWESGILDDSTTQQFRVTPVGTNGNAGTVTTFSIIVARVPDPPAVAYAYSSGTGAVTITAA